MNNDFMIIFKILLFIFSQSKMKVALLVAMHYWQVPATDKIDH